MRPSAISRSIACLAISRRYGSNPDRMIAPGVSSMIRSIPVGSSSARMLRPSRPMMRAFAPSLGRSLNRRGDVVLGLVDGGLARLGVQPLDQVGRLVARLALDLLEQEVLGLFGGQAGHPLALGLLLRNQPVV